MQTEGISFLGRITEFVGGEVIKKYFAISFLGVLIVFYLLFNAVDTMKQPTGKEQVIYFLIHFAEPITKSDFTILTYSDEFVSVIKQWSTKTMKEKVMGALTILKDFFIIIMAIAFFCWYLYVFVYAFHAVLANGLDPTINSVLIALLFGFTLVILGNNLLYNHSSDSLEPEFKSYIYDSYGIPYKGVVRIFTGLWSTGSGSTRDFVYTKIPSYEFNTENATETIPS